MTYVRVHLVLYGEKGPSVGASSTYPKASDIFGNALTPWDRYVVNVLTLGLDPETFVQEDPHPIKKKTLHKHLKTSKTHQIHKISCVIHPTTSTT
jgi:hypothetical protein